MKQAKKMTQPFVMHPLDLIESPAWRALSPDGAKLIDRLELEHLRNAGQDNGRLRVSYAQFLADCGRWRREKHAVADAIAECEALGLLEVRRQLGAANRYRLTYLPAEGHEATHEWKMRGPREAAEAVASCRKPPRERTPWLTGKVIAFK